MSEQASDKPAVADNSLPEALQEGYRDFRRHRYASVRDRYRKLADTGQQPSTMVIACCDSRAAPETISAAGPGEIFVVRNVANLVPPRICGTKPQGQAHPGTWAWPLRRHQRRVESG